MPGRGLAAVAAALSLCFVMAAAGVSPGAAAPPPLVGIAVSRQIRPYLEALEGVVAALEGADVGIRTVTLDDAGGPDAGDVLAEPRPDLVICIGPEATRDLWKARNGFDGRFLYAMVLNPETVIGEASAGSGVPLNIPVNRQVREIAEGLPGSARIGLLFDPRFNARFYEEAEAAAGGFGRTLVPLRVDAKTEIPKVLAGHWDQMDALWMIPDRTVISESIIQYVIKEALFRNVPVIGYNRFFLESGAALAFVIDYGEIGRQAGRLALEVIDGGPCRRVVPAFRRLSNDRVLERMGIAGAKRTEAGGGPSP